MNRKTPHILVLIQNARNRDLLIRFLEEKEGYAVKGATSLDELEGCLKINCRPNIMSFPRK